jgi:hypothetical protein
LALVPGFFDQAIRLGGKADEQRTEPAEAFTQAAQLRKNLRRTPQRQCEWTVTLGDLGATR